MTQTAYPRVEELQAAARALADGHFRGPAPTPPTPAIAAPIVLDGSATWSTDRRVLPVLGTGGGSGATTLALALATVAGPSRVIECCSMSATGLAEAATAELGVDTDGWSNGTRDHVTVSRSTALFTGPAEVPTPTALDAPGLDVLDVGWSLHHLQAATGWISEQLLKAPVVVVTATASVPSLRRLENTVTDLPASTTALLAVRSCGSKRLPAHVRSAIGPATRARITDGCWVEIPHEKDLAERGLSGTPLPRSLLTAAHQIAQLAAVGETTPKGHLA